MSNDSEKTMRPGEPDAEKTMRPAASDADKTVRPPVDPEKTIRPGDSGAEKTMRPADAGVEKTMRPQADADKTMRPDQEQQKEKESMVNRQFTEFELGKVKYTVVKIISDGTGEAQIFLVENKGKQFALKLYYAGIVPPPNHDIMESVRGSAGTGLLVDTFDHGEWTNPQTQQKRDYELMEYCSGGSLDQMKPGGDEKLLGEIALRGAASLDFLHRQHIIHRDVKPANFFFRKPGRKVDDMALADFGIAIVSDENGKAVIDYQLRTKIYAAPEFYDMADGKIQISTKSDFYSLGMMLLALLNGEEIFKLNEFELINMKKHGKLPYPQDLDERSLQLIKALTLPDPNARAGFDEVKRWAAGENIYNLKSERDDVRKFKIVYNPTKDQTAKSPEELAGFMLDDRELATKYLYSGKINQWLTDNLRPDLAIDIETFVEKTYPKDQETGLLASCYRLDEGMPYYDFKGKALSSPQEIADSLKKYISHYSKALSNRNDPLWLFFNARGLANVTNEFAKLFKKGDNRDALLQLIHTLDRTLTWTVVSYDGKTTVECKKPEEVIDVMYNHGISDQSWADLLGEGFLTWLQNADPAVAGKIRSTPGRKERQSAVLYNLSPKVAYNYQMDETAGDYFFTAAEVGNYMNLRMEDFIKDDKDSNANTQLDMLLNIDGTRLWDYLKSKGNYDDKIRWIKYCTDLKSKDNLNKPGPYGWEVAVYKTIKGLGFDPWYTFLKSNKRVYTLAELDAMPGDEVKEELPKFFLQAWMTTFYEENPALDVKKKYAFEKETVKYIEHLRRLDPTVKNVVAFDENQKAVTGPLANLKRKRGAHLFSKVLVALLLLATAGFAIFKLLTVDINIDAQDHTGWIGIVALVVGIIAFLVMWGTSDQGCLINLIVGGVAYGAIFAIIYFLMPFLGYIIAGLLASSLIYVLVACYIRTPMYGKAHRKLFDPTFEELEVEPLQAMFSEDHNAKSSTPEESAKYASYLSSGTKKLWRCLIFPAVLMVGAGFLVWFAGGFGDRPQRRQEPVVVTGTVTANVLNMRSGPGSSDAVVRTLSKGDVLTVTGEAVDGRVPVEIDGATGWVSLEYIQTGTTGAGADSDPDPDSGSVSGKESVPQTSSNVGQTERPTQEVAATPTPETQAVPETQATPDPEPVRRHPLSGLPTKTFDPRPQAIGPDGARVNLFIDRAVIRGGWLYLFFTGSAQGDGGDGYYYPFWDMTKGTIRLNVDDSDGKIAYFPTEKGEDEDLTKVTTGFYLVFGSGAADDVSFYLLEGKDGYRFEDIEIAEIVRR